MTIRSSVSRRTGASQSRGRAGEGQAIRGGVVRPCQKASRERRGAFLKRFVASPIPSRLVPNAHGNIFRRSSTIFPVPSCARPGKSLSVLPGPAPVQGSSASAPSPPPDVSRTGTDDSGGPRLIVLTAPSGAGKTTIARRVLEAMPEVRFSVSATTRAPRPGEENGTHYHFLSEERFRDCIKEGGLVEYEEVYPGQFYGTLRSELERGDAPVLLDIDVKGAASIKEAYGSRALVLFVRPPSWEALARRLKGRGTEADEDLDKRLRRAAMELERADACDAVVVNDDLDEAVEETLRLTRSFVKG